MNLTEKLEELKQIAGKATPAPWAVYGTADQHVRTNVGASEFRLYKIKHRGDAAHIAAFNPEVALAFVEAVGALQTSYKYLNQFSEEGCDDSVGWHTPECCIERDFGEALAKLSKVLGCEK